MAETCPIKKKSVIIFSISIFIHLVFLFSLKTGTLNTFFHDATHRYGQGVDFYSVYQAASNFLDGKSIYERTPSADTVPFYYPYRYHPFTAVFIGVPLTLLKAPQAYWFWVIIQEVFLVINLKLTWQIFASRPQNRFIAMSLWLFFSPYYLELFMGQFSFFMATLLFWTLVLWEDGRMRLGTFFWTLSLMIKSNTALFGAILLREKKYGSLLIAGLISITFAIPYFLYMPGSFTMFILNITQGLNAGTILGNMGFTALLAVSWLKGSGAWATELPEFIQALPRMNETIRIPILMWTLLVLASALWVTFKERQKSFTLMGVLWVLVYFLIYKHVWEHQYVMILPACILLYRKLNSGVAPSPIERAVFYISFALLALPTAFWMIDPVPYERNPEFSWTLFQSLVFHLPKPLATFFLYGITVKKLLARTENIH